MVFFSEVPVMECKMNLLSKNSIQEVSPPSTARVYVPKNLMYTKIRVI